MNSEVDTEDTDLAILQGHLAKLEEHFDSVQIFVTRKTSDGTINAHIGGGNWFARFGQVRAWILGEEAGFGKTDL